MLLIVIVMYSSWRVVFGICKFECVIEHMYYAKYK
jgi:hypothetical protein